MDILTSDFSASQDIEATKELKAKSRTHTPIKKRYAWEKVNEVTWKLASTTESANTPASHGQWGGYRTPKALAWLMGIGNSLDCPPSR
jgi:hypothetical protein